MTDQLSHIGSIEAKGKVSQRRRSRGCMSKLSRLQPLLSVSDLRFLQISSKCDTQRCFSIGLHFAFGLAMTGMTVGLTSFYFNLYTDKPFLTATLQSAWLLQLRTRSAKSRAMGSFAGNGSFCWYHTKLNSMVPIH